MSFRLLNAALGCVLAFTFLVALGQSVNAQLTPWEGTVTLCEGHATLVRGDKAYRVVRGAGIRLGDTIETGDDAKIAMALERGPAITMGAGATLRVNCVEGQWNVSLQRGETRLVHDGESELRVITPESEIWVDRAIVQLKRSPGETRFELAAGTAVCQSTAKSPRRISQRDAFVISADGRFMPLQQAEWDLQGDQIRLAAAMQTGPALQPPPPPVDVPGRSADAIGRPSELPPLSDTDPLLADEQDELPDFAQDLPAAATRGAADDGLGEEDRIGAFNSPFGGSSSLSLGSLASSTGSFFSGGLFGDANQQTFQGRVDGNIGPFPDGSPFPGGIHLVTAETQYPFSTVQLTASESAKLFASGTSKYFAIGTGALPTGQVLTNFFTGTGAVPTVIDVPQFDAHLIYLDQYNIPDAAQGALNSNIGLTGLIGPTPTGPTVIGTTPLADDQRAKLNPGATFALGEFLVTNTNPGGPGGPDVLTFTVRRSDQDRLIVKDPGGNDAQDLVTPNTDVTFVDAVDPRFLPQSPTVKVPASVANTGTSINEVDRLRRAAFTTLVADQLQDYSRRTGQTRFVVDGKIIDISGFRPSP